MQVLLNVRPTTSKTLEQPPEENRAYEVTIWGAASNGHFFMLQKLKCVLFVYIIEISIERILEVVLSLKPEAR